MLKSGTDAETRAIERLIAQIDALDQWRDRTGRRVLWLFGVVFAAALGLLAWVALSQGPPKKPLLPEGPKVPAVLQNFRQR
jgi:hypothetical protein